ncbi:MAG: hypothetical protein M3010_00100 [Candidatus Dormibacteraeota bacterium]|nr:hypothetical protein [Candidatus Dormibacteraeota bacterium]
MPRTRIPDVIKAQVADRIAVFNREVLPDPNIYYRARYQGAFLYLERCDYGQVARICRLAYTGTLDHWDFAIYKYSDERYDPDEWFFPGAAQVDGTLEGAMRAGMAAYPP